MPGLLLLHHPVHEAITDGEMRAALADAGVPIIPVKIEPAKVALADTPHLNWEHIRHVQEELVEKKLRPLLDEYPDYEIAYFGLAPVPLAIHLGDLVGRWRRSHVYQRHHTERTWIWRTEGTTPVIGLDTEGFPQDIIRSDDDVVLRVSVTARVDPVETRSVVPVTSAELDISVSKPGEDVLMALSDLELVAAKVKEALDRLTSHRPNARLVHLFAAVPTGLAFRLGTLVSATQHHQVQTYQYFHAGDPRHRRAILLRDDAPRARALTEADRGRAATLRETWAADMSRVQELSGWIAAKRSSGDLWFSLIGVPDAPWGDSWRRLACFNDTAMANSCVDVEVAAVEGGFRFQNERNAWLVGDDLLTAISDRLEDPDRLKRAGRMLFFHESLHAQTHRLTEATAPAIRRFPKILEEVDYQADVWGMLHEFAFTKRFHPEQAANERALFLDIAKTAVETMWAFDDGPEELNRMELRRVNRYLIWYWQLLRLERCNSLADVVSVLSKKPLIELAGPRVHATGDRVFYELREPWGTDLELAAQLDDNRIVRHGRGGATNVPALIAGLRRRLGAEVRLVLKSIADQQAVS